MSVLSALLVAIDEVNLQLPADRRLTKAPDTILLGAGGKLDSLGYVNFVIAAEVALEGMLGEPVNLADAILSQPNGKAPKTVGELADFVTALRDRDHA